MVVLRGIAPVVWFGGLAYLGRSLEFSAVLIAASMIWMAYELGIKSTWREMAVEAMNIVIDSAVVTAYMYTVKCDVVKPSLARIGFELAVYYVLQDIWFYLMHYDMHNGCWKYARKIHTWHHSVHTDCFLKAFYNHPLEPLLLAVPSLLVGHATLRIFGYGSRLSMLMWIPIAVFDILYTHSGGYIDWLPDTRIHALHHIRGRGNYASPHLDKLLGTSVDTRELDNLMKVE